MKTLILSLLTLSASAALALGPSVYCESESSNYAARFDLEKDTFEIGPKDSNQKGVSGSGEIEMIPGSESPTHFRAGYYNWGPNAENPEVFDAFAEIRVGEGPKSVFHFWVFPDSETSPIRDFDCQLEKTAQHVGIFLNF